MVEIVCLRNFEKRKFIVLVWTEIKIIYIGKLKANLKVDLFNNLWQQFYNV